MGKLFHISTYNCEPEFQIYLKECKSSYPSTCLCPPPMLVRVWLPLTLLAAKDTYTEWSTSLKKHWHIAERIIPTLPSLHQLPVKFSIDFKVLLLIFRAFRDWQIFCQCVFLRVTISRLLSLPKEQS